MPLSKHANRLLGIDALRGIAALLVVLYHSRADDWVGMQAFFSSHPGWSWNPQVWLVWVTTPLRLGFLGVQLLFVLSGYCIHRNQARGLAAGDDVRLDLPRYAFRRFFRIYPTYIAALILNGLVLYQLLPWLFAHGHPATVDGHHSWYVFFMNLLTMQNILPGVEPYEGVFWSLSIEIHLYIAYIFILWLTRRYGPGRMLLVSLAGTLLWPLLGMAFGRFPAVGQILAFGDFVPYWYTWCIGAYVAEMQMGRARLIKLPKPVWWAAMAFCGCGGAMLMLGSQIVAVKQISHPTIAETLLLQLRPVAEILLATGTAAALFWSLQPKSDRVWTSWVGRSLAFVGMFSYSLYAIHVPILSTFVALWGGKSMSLVPSLLAVLCALAVAYLFFNLVERWTLTPPKGFFLTKKAVPPRAPHEKAASAEVSVGQG